MDVIETFGDTSKDAPEDTTEDTPHDGGDAPTQSTQPKKKRKSIEKRSEVWGHYKQFIDKDKNHKAKCVHCGGIFGADSRNGTTTLKNHLTKCKRFSSVDLKQSQLILPSGQNSSLSSWSFDQEEVRNALAYMIIVDELPFKFVEREGFQHFVSKACPNFRIPSRWTVARDCFKLYEDEKNLLMVLLKSTKQRVCLTTDTWTSIQRVNYMCLTAHYIDNDWKLHKKIINFCPISSHRGRDIGWEIEKCLHDWGIDRVFTVTVDNASSNDVALAYLKENISQWGENIRNCNHMHMRCIAHVFNLVVQDGLKEIGSSVKKIRNAVRFVRHSTARMKRFKECCELEKISSKSLLCLDVPTRWNSTYLMLDAATTFEKAFSRYDVLDPTYAIDLESDDGVPGKVDWMKARRMLNFLKIFYEATCKISGSLYVTSNLFLHEIYKVQILLQAFIEDRDGELGKMAENMKQKFDKYWGDPRKMNKVIFMAVVVDPRYKLKWVKLALTSMYDVELANSIAKEVEDELVDMCGDYKQPIVMEKVDEHGQMELPSAELEDNDTLKNAWKKLGSIYETFHHKDGNDIHKFLKEDTESGGPKFDILAWWKVNESKYPVLSQVARDILAVPISTVASESAFSTGGRVLDPFRSSLGSKVVEFLVCGQDWLRKSFDPVNVEEILQDVEKMEEGMQKLSLQAPTN